MIYAFSRELYLLFYQFIIDSSHFGSDLPENPYGVIRTLNAYEALNIYLIENRLPVQYISEGLWSWTIRRGEILASHPAEKEWTISTIGELFKQYWSEMPVTLRRVTPADVIHSIYIEEDFREINVFAETDKGPRLLIGSNLVVDFDDSKCTQTSNELDENCSK